MRRRTRILTGILTALLLSIALGWAWPYLIFQLRAEPFTPILVEQAPGPLRVSAENPRYFADPSGRIRYLVGSHTWPNLQDMGFEQPPPTFDYEAWLDFCAHYGLNFFRLWMVESQRAHPKSAKRGFFDHHAPAPWARPGPGEARDGLPRYDLTQFDEVYFSRMRERVITAGERGIYVSVMLFNGWSIQDKGGEFGNPWFAHPFHRDNNINGIDGDLDGDESGGEIHALDSSEVTALQEAYLRRVVDTVGDLENVLFEISNESTMASVAWQYHMIETLKNYEATRPLQHPVGMTVCYPEGENSVLLESPADWISPRGEIRNPLASDGSKVVVEDTDHICGVCGRIDWIWRAFARGLNPLLMDPYDGAAVGSGPNARGTLEDPHWIRLRTNLGYTRAYAARLGLRHAVPRPDLVSSGDCLSSLGRSPRPRFLVFLADGISTELDLSEAEGSFAMEWLDPNQGRVLRRGRLDGGSIRRISPPFFDDAVLYLEPIH